jgi:CheY-like chemotaxis protein
VGLAGLQTGGPSTFVNTPPFPVYYFAVNKRFQIASYFGGSRINPCVKIIAVSGLSLSESIAQAVALGALNFLSKPYTAETLLRKIQHVLTTD